MRRKIYLSIHFSCESISISLFPHNSFPYPRADNSLMGLWIPLSSFFFGRFCYLVGSWENAQAPFSLSLSLRLLFFFGTLKTTLDSLFQVSMMEKDFYLGRILTGRVSSGLIRIGDRVHGLRKTDSGAEKIEEGKVGSPNCLIVVKSSNVITLLWYWMSYPWIEFWTTIAQYKSQAIVMFSKWCTILVKNLQFRVWTRLKVQFHDNKRWGNRFSLEIGFKMFGCYSMMQTSIAYHMLQHLQHQWNWSDDLALGFLNV